MRLYGTELPDPVSQNISKAIQIARNIHQGEIYRRTRNTDAQKWDKYWVKIYNLVLEQLKKIEVKK